MLVAPDDGISADWHNSPSIIGHQGRFAGGPMLAEKCRQSTRQCLPSKNHRNSLKTNDDGTFYPTIFWGVPNLRSLVILSGASRRFLFARDCRSQSPGWDAQSKNPSSARPRVGMPTKLDKPNAVG